jgi:hypothetical protein
MTGTEWNVIGRVLSGCAWIARTLRLEGGVWRAREVVTLSVLRQLHLGVMHSVRKIATNLELAQGDRNGASEAALALVGEARKAMGTFLEIKPANLHCCIKLIEEDHRSVGTWARSTPHDGRPVEIVTGQSHAISENTVWSCLLGEFDGRAKWRPFTCFCCNDLKAAGSDFRCSRDNWQNFYASALVFPIRYPTSEDGLEFATVGFIAFDSPNVGAFRGMPSIFDYENKPAQYREKLEDSAVFHVGSIIADALGSFLRPENLVTRRSA